MHGSATTLNLASIVSHHARLAPDNEAIVCGEIRITYGELDRLSNRVANALVEMGIGHGDKVALNCVNVPYFPIVYYGIIKADSSLVPSIISESYGQKAVRQLNFIKLGPGIG